jgi:hypothetical protein
MLLFSIKYSRPDLANVVRDLSKCMDGVSHAAYKEMLSVMKFVRHQVVFSKDATS